MPFGTTSNLIWYSRKTSASAIRMDGPSGALVKNDRECVLGDGVRDFRFSFNLSESIVEGQRFVFYSSEERIVGEVVENGAIIEIDEASSSHNEVFGGDRRLISDFEEGVAKREVIDLVPVNSISELAGLYSTGRVGAEVLDLTSPYRISILAPSGTYQIGEYLSKTFAKIRGSHEVEAVYVRPADLPAATTFEPLDGKHLARVGEVAIVVRERHPLHPPRIIGIMMAKDEADVISEVITSLTTALEKLYYHAGDEATEKAIQEASPRGWAVSVPVGNGHLTDGIRERLLRAARTDADARPTWVMVVQGDEVYEESLREQILLAHAERATIMTAQVATFVIHESQREGWDWSRPLATRLPFYVWDFGEHAGFLDFPWVHYWENEHMRAFPHGCFPSKYAAARPVRRHYPFRDPDQATARIEDRLKSGWQPHYENYRKVFMNGEAAGRLIKRYHGWFPEAERVNGIW